MLRSIATGLLCLGALALTSPAFATPGQVAHQGRLLDADELPLEGEHTLLFRLYNDLDEGDLLWEEAYDVEFTNGFYSLLLGEDEGDNSLDDWFTGETDLFLELTVDAGDPLLPRQRLTSVPYATTSTHVDGGSVDATEIRVGGELIVDSGGAWVGDSPALSWEDLLNVPVGFADGEDADSLADFSCQHGDVLVYDLALTQWDCAELVDTDTQLTEAQVDAFIENNGYASAADLAAIATSGDWADLQNIPIDLADEEDADTLMALSCADGELAAWDAGLMEWVCAIDWDSNLTESEVDSYVSNNGYAANSDLADIATSGDWSDLQNVPADLADEEDADTLLELSCSDGMLAAWNSGQNEWVCAVDTDTNLSESEVEVYVTNDALDLASGTTIGGSSIATGAHTTDTDTNLSESEVEAYVTNDALALASGTTVGGSSIASGAHTTDTNLSESEVEAYITNASIDLASGTTVGGSSIATGAHTTDTDTDTNLSESEVEAYITNDALDLASGTTVGGSSISTATLTSIGAAVYSNCSTTTGTYVYNASASCDSGDVALGAGCQTGGSGLLTDIQISGGSVTCKWSYYSSSKKACARCLDIN